MASPASPVTGGKEAGDAAHWSDMAGSLARCHGSEGCLSERERDLLKEIGRLS